MTNSEWADVLIENASKAKMTAVCIPIKLGPEGPFESLWIEFDELREISKRNGGDYIPK